MDDMRKLINLVESKLSESSGIPEVGDEEDLSQWKDNYNKGYEPEADDEMSSGLPEVGDMYKGGMVRKVIGMTDDGFKTSKPEYIDYYKIIVSGVQGYGGANGDHQYFVDKTGQEMNEAKNSLSAKTIPASCPKCGATDTPKRKTWYLIGYRGSERRIKCMNCGNFEKPLKEAKVAVHPVTGKKKRFPDSATRDQIMAWKNSTPEPKKKKRSFSDMDPSEIDDLPQNKAALGDQAKLQAELEDLYQQQEDYMTNWRNYGLASPEQGQAAAEELQIEMDNIMQKLDRMQGLGHFHEGVKGPHVSIKLDLNDQEYRTIRQASMRGNFNHDFSQVNGVTKINTNAPNTLGKDLENLLDSGETSWYEIIRGQMTGPGAQDIGESFMDMLTRKGLFK